jgi:hypothetical protein
MMEIQSGWSGAYDDKIERAEVNTIDERGRNLKEKYRRTVNGLYSNIKGSINKAKEDYQYME